MTPSRRAMLSLCALVIPLGLCLALLSILWSGPVSAAAFIESVHGDPVKLYGVGVYRYNPVMLGAGFAAQDPVLIAALLFLGFCAVSLARGAQRVLIPVLGALGFLTYVYASMALGAAFDWAYPAYFVLFSASVFALWFAARDGIQVLAPQEVPHRWLAVFIECAGLATFAIWASQLVADFWAGRTPARLDTQMATVTTSFDLGLIVPLCLTASVIIWRWHLMGSVIAYPLLGCLVGLFPWIILATIWQLRAGVALSIAEFVGPITGFAVLGLGSAGFLYAAWRGAVARDPDQLPRPAPP